MYTICFNTNKCIQLFYQTGCVTDSTKYKFKYIRMDITANFIADITTTEEQIIFRQKTL